MNVFWKLYATPFFPSEENRPEPDQTDIVVKRKSELPGPGPDREVRSNSGEGFHLTGHVLLFRRQQQQFGQIFEAGFLCFIRSVLCLAIVG